MVLVKEVHRQILRMSYQDEASNFVEVLEGLSRVLERDVLPLSQAIDGKGSGIDAPRKALFKAGLCQMPFPVERVIWSGADGRSAMRCTSS